MKLGDLLAELREDRGLTQLELSEQLHISNSSISAYETGARLPNLETLLAFAEYFDVTTDYLLGLTDNPISPSVMAEEYCDGVRMDALISMLQELSSAQRAAILLVIQNMKFYAEISEKAAMEGKEKP